MFRSRDFDSMILIQIRDLNLRDVDWIFIRINLKSQAGSSFLREIVKNKQLDDNFLTCSIFIIIIFFAIKYDILNSEYVSLIVLILSYSLNIYFIFYIFSLI